MKEQGIEILTSNKDDKTKMTEIFELAQDYFGDDGCMKGGVCQYQPDGKFDGCFVGVFLTPEEQKYFDNIDENGINAFLVYPSLPHDHVIKHLPVMFWIKGQDWHDSATPMKRRHRKKMLEEYIQDY